MHRLVGKFGVGKTLVWAERDLAAQPDRQPVCLSADRLGWASMHIPLGERVVYQDILLAVPVEVSQPGVLGIVRPWPL